MHVILAYLRFEGACVVYLIRGLGLRICSFLLFAEKFRLVLSRSLLVLFLFTVVWHFLLNAQMHVSIVRDFVLRARMHFSGVGDPCL